jgi:hypothetical protein
VVNAAAGQPADPIVVERLSARVAALEEALERRSREIRLLQRHVCKRDLLLIARLAAGLAPLPRGAFEPVLWRETTELTRTEVEETMLDLWQSLAPFDASGPGAGPR